MSLENIKANQGTSSILVNMLSSKVSIMLFRMRTPGVDALQKLGTRPMIDDWLNSRLGAADQAKVTFVDDHTIL